MSSLARALLVALATLGIQHVTGYSIVFNSTLQCGTAYMTGSLIDSTTWIILCNDAYLLYDVTTPTAPVLKASTTFNMGVYACPSASYYNGFLYVNTYTFDVRDPANPVIASRAPIAPTNAPIFVDNVIFRYNPALEPPDPFVGYYAGTWDISNPSDEVALAYIPNINFTSCIKAEGSIVCVDLTGLCTILQVPSLATTATFQCAPGPIIADIGYSEGYFYSIGQPLGMCVFSFPGAVGTPKPISCFGQQTLGGTPFLAGDKLIYFGASFLSQAPGSIFDMSDPLHPVKIAALEYLAQFRFTPPALSVVGDLLFVAGSHGAFVFDITPPVVPTGRAEGSVAKHDIETKARQMRTAGMVSTIDAPPAMFVAATDLGGGAVLVSAQVGDSLFVVFSSNVLQVFNVSNAANPVAIPGATLDLGTDPKICDLYARADYIVFATECIHSVVIIDARSLPSLKLASRITSLTNPRSTLAGGDYIAVCYNVTCLATVNVSDIYAPQVVATTCTGNAVNDGSGVFAKDNSMFVSCTTVGSIPIECALFTVPDLQVISEFSASPFRDNLGPALLTAFGDLLYASSTFTIIFNISDVQAPTVVSQFGETEAYPFSVIEYENYVWAYSLHASTVMDVSTPSAPRQVFDSSYILALNNFNVVCLTSIESAKGHMTVNRNGTGYYVAVDTGFPALSNVAGKVPVPYCVTYPVL